jgi:hypothetical protein
MPTEWLKVMLEEIERRRDDARRAREEEEQRRKEKGAQPSSRPAAQAG